jgi:hypothetical protein
MLVLWWAKVPFEKLVRAVEGLLSLKFASSEVLEDHPWKSTGSWVPMKYTDP